MLVQALSDHFLVSRPWLVPVLAGQGHPKDVGGNEKFKPRLFPLSLVLISAPAAPAWLSKHAGDPSPLQGSEAFLLSGQLPAFPWKGAGMK